MTRFKTLGRFGTLCGVLAIVAFTTGCPFGGLFDQCNGVDCNDDDPCTADSCSGGTCSHDAVEDCCQTAADCNDNNTCTIDACSNIENGAGSCTNTAVGQNCCNEDSDCGAGNVCTNGNCVADNTNGNDNGNTNGNDNGNTNDNDNTNGNDNGNADGGDAQAGQTFYTANGCAGCHGADASGGNGPNIQGESADEIFSTLTGGSHPVTINTLTEQQAADLAAYLATF